MKNQVKTVSEVNIFAAAGATVIKAMLVTALALLILTLFMFYGNISDAVANACSTVAAFVSVFSAGFMTARKRKCAGFLSGLVAGIIYVLFALILGSVITGSFSVSAETVKMLAVSVLGSVIGGIFGVNIKKRK